MKLSIQTPANPYEILIENNSLEKIGIWLSELFTPQKICIVTDDVVLNLYEATVRESLETQGIQVHTFFIPHGEESKSFVQAQKIYDFLATEGFTRSDGILALGGGVVGDLAGFVASTYMRGIPFVQVPTTLLAQVDSSIGGKTAVNTAQAKNLIGTFAQPKGVLIDPQTLQTLSKERLSEGIAEIIKAALIADDSLWQDLERYQNQNELLEDIESVLTKSLQVKKHVVEVDPFDTGERLILNFGHTIAHALEVLEEYGNITHGQAVAVGMLAMNKMSEKAELTHNGLNEDIQKMLEKYNLPTQSKLFSAEQIFQAITHDKKARGNVLKIILLEKIGQAKIETVSFDFFWQLLKNSENMVS